MQCCDPYEKVLFFSPAVGDLLRFAQVLFLQKQVTFTDGTALSSSVTATRVCIHTVSAVQQSVNAGNHPLRGLSIYALLLFLSIANNNTTQRNGEQQT
jgi:hypothetical protein